MIKLRGGFFVYFDEFFIKLYIFMGYWVYTVMFFILAS